MKPVNVIIDEILERGYKIGQSINYAEFLQIYAPYKEQIDEKTFAELLEIPYRHIKAYPEAKTRILKNVSNATETRQNGIREKIVAKGYKKAQSIDYQEFLQLYGPYQKELTEKYFAKILGVSYSNYMNMKNRNKKVRILKDRSNINENRKREILQQIKMQGYKVGSLIDYAEFLKLYEPYKKEMTEMSFAEIIGIQNSNYKSMKNKKSKARILRGCFSVSEEEKDKIKNLIMADGYIDGKSINYQDFLQLYQKYGSELTEKDFAEILGISYDSYQSIKNKDKKVKIKFNKRDIELVKQELIIQNRQYTKQELKQICDNAGITLNELLMSLYQSKKTVQKMAKRKSIYIGRCQVPKSFQEKYAKELLDEVNRISKMYGKKYGRLYMADDIASQMIVHILEKRGDIVLNSDTEEAALKSLCGYANIYIKYTYISMKVNCGISLDENIKPDDRKKYTRHDVIGDKQKSVTEMVEEKEFKEICKSSGYIIIDMMQLIERGIARKKILQLLMQKYEMDMPELMSELEKQFCSNKSVRVKKDGSVYLGEGR